MSVDASRRRHPAHRRDGDVLRGEGRHRPSAASTPRDFALIAYGGAGPLHAVAIAREIGIRNVIIPRAPGISAPSACCSRTCATISCARSLMRLADAPFDEIEGVSRG